MKILLTGATGYIGKRLLPVLLEHGHEVVALVRDRDRVQSAWRSLGNLQIIEGDLLSPESLNGIPADINVAYYLVHSMRATMSGFEDLEKISARNFIEALSKTEARQIIYLGGISNADKLSRHLESRRNVEIVLAESTIPLTILRAGIIVGSGSGSFEIIRDLVEKLPVMVTPRWLNTRCQPIAVRNVVRYLVGVILNEKTYNEIYDIGGPDILTYKEMLLQFAEVRKLRRAIFILPVMTPRLSSYWLFFITSTSYNLAVNLVNSMKVEVVCADNRIRDIVPIELLTYRESIALAFEQIEQDLVLSSWKDAMVSGNRDLDLGKFVRVPTFGCYKDKKRIPITGSAEQVVENIWSIGGERGWYYGNLLWRLRGFFDKLAGGVGLRRGRTNISVINEGDVLDFWRVIIADRKERRLLLFAEMKLPGEAWLEFRVEDGKEPVLKQTATFRPRGLWGRLYWWMLFPFHVFIFRNMARRIVEYKQPAL